MVVVPTVVLPYTCLLLSIFEPFLLLIIVHLLCCSLCTHDIHDSDQGRDDDDEDDSDGEGDDEGLTCVGIPVERAAGNRGCRRGRCERRAAAWTWIREPDCSRSSDRLLKTT